MKTTDLFKTSAKQLNESLAKTFGQKLNLESFDTPKLEDARNKLRTQISQVRNESGFNETIENEALSKAQWMLDSINAEIAERAEHIVADPVNEDDVDEARYGSRDAYQRDYDSSRTGFGRREREDDEYHNGGDYDPEFERNKQETYMYNIKVNGEIVNDEPFFGRSAALAWAKEQIAAGKLDAKNSVLSPVHESAPPTAKGERMVKHIKKGYADDGKLTDKEKSIAYATAWKAHNKNESIEQTGDDMRNLNEGEIQQASAIVTAKTMVDRVGRWIEELSGMENDTLLTLGDSIRDEMGQEAAKNFISACAPAIQQALQNLKDTREALSTSVRALTGEEQPAEMLGAEAPDMGADMGSGLEGEEEMPAEPDAMNAGDEFGAADAAAGGSEELGRMKRESIDRSSRLLKVLAG